MTRFSAPLNPVEVYRCDRCGEERHYTLLNDDWLCPGCVAEVNEREEIEQEQLESK